MSTPSEHIMQFFSYSHLPEHLRVISQPFAEMADRLVGSLPRNPERTVALRKLLEAKDAAVRARLAVPSTVGLGDSVAAPQSPQGASGPQ